LARKVERWGRHTYSDMMIRTIIYVPCHVNAGTDNWRVKIEGDTHSSIEGDTHTSIEGDTHTSLRETHIHQKTDMHQDTDILGEYVLYISL